MADPDRRGSRTSRPRIPPRDEAPDSPLRASLHEIIFEAETPAGKAFDVVLLVLILASVTAVMLESVDSVRSAYGLQLRVLEWIVTVLFSIEYVLRLLCVKRPLRYALSFYGIVDLLAVLPTYLSLVFAGAQTLLVIRAIRLLRIFRVFKLTHFLSEARMLNLALKASRHKIIVFLGTVLSLVMVMGTLMYLIEGPENGFTSIPESVYWAIVTMTTVGYGDIAPKTIAGRTLAAFIMILGYAIIAVPTGIVSVELAEAQKKLVTTQACPSCGSEGHDSDATHCKFCGALL